MPKKNSPDVQRQLDEARGVLEKKFLVSPAQGMTELLRMQYMQLFLATEGFTTLKGKKILDIGCGSLPSALPEGMTERRTNDYEPWFARFAQAFGADVTGLDRRASPQENYRHIQVDLTKPDDPHSLRSLPDDSFDLVNVFALVSPAVPKHVKHTDMTSTEFYGQSQEALTALHHEIHTQALRIIREGGYYIENTTIFRKYNGAFKKVDTMPLVAKYGFPPEPRSLD